MDPVSPATQLARAAQAGDHRAFTTLVRDADEMMRRLAFRLVGSTAAMDDALQDAYLKAYRKIDTYKGTASFSTWLYAIVYRTCLDHIRVRARRKEVEIDLARHVTGGTDPATRASEADALETALAELPADQVAVVILVDREGLAYTEAAEILDVREGTIASRLSRAHTALRAALDPTEVISDE